MKANYSNRKMGKRTFTLKELAQRDFGAAATSTTTVTTEVNTKDLAPTFSLVGIQEDLLDSDGREAAKVLKVPSEIATAPSQGVKTSKGANQEQSLTLPIELINHLIAKEISATAQSLDLEEAELQAWLDLQVMVPKQTLLALLRIAKENRLDPLKEEVALALYDDCQWQAFITVEGYSKILNHHPAFDGISFVHSAESANGIPIWMECTIYRKDRSKPIVVREYFEEVKGEQAIWQKMPRRMLRHRVMQQCARLAIG